MYLLDAMLVADIQTHILSMGRPQPHLWRWTWGNKSRYVPIVALDKYHSFSSCPILEARVMNPDGCGRNLRYFALVLFTQRSGRKLPVLLGRKREWQLLIPNLPRPLVAHCDARGTATQRMCSVAFARCSAVRSKSQSSSVRLTKKTLIEKMLPTERARRAMCNEYLMLR